MAFDASLDQTVTLKLGIEPTEVTKRTMEELGQLTLDLENALTQASRAQLELAESVPGVSGLVEGVRAQQAAITEALRDWRDQLPVPLLGESMLTSAPTQAPIPNNTGDGGDAPAGDTQAPQPDSTGHEWALNRAATQAGLHARRLPDDPETINAVTRQPGGLLSALPDLQGENGGLMQQAAATARTVTSRVLNNEQRPAGPRIAHTANEAGIDLARALSTAPEGDPQAGSPTALLEEIRDELRAQTRTPRAASGAASAPAPSATTRPRTRRISGSTGAVATPGITPTSSGDEGLSEALQAIRQGTGLNGRNQTHLEDSLLRKASQVSSVGRGLTQASQALGRSATAAEASAAGSGLVTAGSQAARGAATGLGSLGSTVSSAGSMLGGLASKAAAPLAVASLAYDGLNAAGDAWVSAQQSGSIDGGYGGDAVWQGMSNNMQDWWRGLNPFSSVSSDDYRRYREQIAGMGLGITQGSTAANTLSGGLATAQDMGIDSRTVLSIFGRAVKDDPDFDLDESLKDLADAAKESTLSLKDFAEATAKNNQLLNEGLGVEDGLAVEIGEDLATSLTAEGGIESDTGLFGSQALGEQYKNKVLTAGTQQNYQLLQAAQRRGIGGIDMADTLGSTQALVKYLGQTENGTDLLNELMEDAAVYGLDGMSNDTAYQQALAQRTGVNVGGRAVEMARRQTGQDNRTQVDITVTAGAGLETIINDAIKESNALNGLEDYGSASAAARERSDILNSPGMGAGTSH